MPSTVSFRSSTSGADRLLAGKGQQLPGEVGRASGGLADLHRDRRAAGADRVHLLQGQLRIAEDDAEHVVEIVGHAAGQPAHGFHLLGLEELGLKSFPFLLRLLALGDVAEIPHSADNLVPHTLGLGETLEGSSIPEFNNVPAFLLRLAVKSFDLCGKSVWIFHLFHHAREQLRDHQSCPRSTWGCATFRRISG